MGRALTDTAKSNAAAQAQANKSAAEKQAAATTPSSQGGSLGSSGQAFGNGRVGFTQGGQRTVDNSLFVPNNQYNRDALFKAGVNANSQGSTLLVSKTDLESAAAVGMFSENSQQTQSSQFNQSKPKEVDLTENLFLSDKGKAKNQTSDASYGGVETPQSKGKSYGTAFVEGQTGGKFLVRNSPGEAKVKADQATQALRFSPSQSNKDYFTGGKPGSETNVVTLGKAESVFGKTSSGEFGWKDIGTNQLVRNSKQENAVKQDQAERAVSLFPSKANTDYVTGGKPNNVKEVSLNENLTIGEFAKGENPNASFNAFLNDVSSKGGSVDIFTSTGGKIGTIKADQSGKALITDILSAQPGYYARASQGPSGFDSGKQRSFADTISAYGNEGATIKLFSGNKLVATVSGPNAYRETEILSTKNPNLIAQVVYSTTREGKAMSETLVEKANAVGSPSIDVMFTNKSGKQEIVESIPISNAKQTLPSILDKYVGNQNISFTYTQPSVKTEKQTTGVPASILPLELNYLSNKNATGKYYDFEQRKGDFLGNSKLPFFASTDKTIKIAKGVEVNVPSTAIGEFGQTVGSQFIGFFKNTPVLLTGLGTEVYSIFRTGSSGGPQAKPTSAKALVNVLAQGAAYPQDLLSSHANYNAEKVQSGIHENIGKPIKETGLILPQPVSEAKTSGVFAGNVFMIGMSIAGFKDIIPFRITKIPLPVKEGVPTYSGITLGYEGPRSSYLIGKVGNKLVIGKPTAEELHVGAIEAPSTRYGFESGIGKPVVNNIITDIVVPSLEKSGRITKTGALDITETGKEGLPLAVKAPSTLHNEGFGETPFRNLSKEQTGVLFGFIKEKNLTVTGSTAEIPFTLKGLRSQARDVDIKGVNPKKASKFTTELSSQLQAKALPGQTFEPVAKDFTINLKTQNAAGLVTTEKILEFPQHDVHEGTFGFSEEDKGYVFGQKTPTGTTKVNGVKTVEFNYQGMRKTASSTELHKGIGESITVRAASGREVKDPAHVFSFLKTKAANYLEIGKVKEGNRLNEIADAFRSRHPELDFSKEFGGVSDTTLHFENIKSPGLIKSFQSNGVSPKITSGVILSKSSISPSIKSSRSSTSSSVFNSKTSKSASSGFSDKSGKSGFSGFSAKSGMSMLIKSSGFSGKGSKSGISRKSSKSGLSGFSAKSGKSGKSALSMLSGQSGKSGKSGSSGKSAVSGLSGLSGSSLISGFSGKSGQSGKSNISGFSSLYGGKGAKKLPKLLANIGRKRNPRTTEGPTALRRLNVHNVFSSDLSIIEPSNKKYEF